MAHPGGRPSKYKEEYCDELIVYFDIEPYREVEVTHKNKKGEEWTTFEDKPNDLPTMQGFARKIKVSTDTLQEWKKVHKEFSVAYKKARAIQEDIWITNSIRGLYNPAFTIFTGKNIFGWRDKIDTDITSGGKELPILGGSSTVTITPKKNDLSTDNSDTKVASTA